MLSGGRSWGICVEVGCPEGLPGSCGAALWRQPEGDLLPSGPSPFRISEVIDGSLQTAVSRFSAVCACWGGLTSSWTCMGRTDSRALLSPGLYLVSEENAFLFLHLWKGTACQAPPSSCWHHPPAWVWKS